MPDVKTVVAAVANGLKGSNRAVKNQEQERRKHHATFAETQRRYRHDQAALLAEHTWTCPYCGKEQPPQVYRLHHCEGVQIVNRERCGCSGELEALAAERAAQAQNKDPFEAHQWLSYMRQAGLVGWLARATFDTYVPENHEQELQRQTCRRYCDSLLRGELGEKPWLILYGAVGTGKTHLAAAVTHEAMAAGWQHCRLRVWPEWLEALQATFDGEGKASVLVDELKAGQLVVIDDIDKQHPTRSGWAEEKLWTALNHRHNRRLATILTFNHSPIEMVPWLGSALVDRMIERAFECLRFEGRSHRSDIPWR